MQIQFLCLAIVGLGVVGCSGVPEQVETHFISSRYERLRAELAAADEAWERLGAHPDSVVVLEAGGNEERALIATWSSCFDAPDKTLLIFDADSSTFADDVFDAVGIFAE